MLKTQIVMSSNFSMHFCSQNLTHHAYCWKVKLLVFYWVDICSIFNFKKI